MGEKLSLEKQEELYGEFKEFKDKFLEKLEGLKNGDGQLCNCDYDKDNITVNFVRDNPRGWGNKVVVTYCLRCGGIVES